MTGTAPRRAYVALGANLPLDWSDRILSPAETLQLALRALAETAGILSVRASSLWSSEPVLAEGPTFVNGVAEVLTDQSPTWLLDQLLLIESRFGRERPIAALNKPAAASTSHPTARLSAARSLDLDLIWMEGARSQTDHLHLPHPRAAERAFVLEPLAELSPNLVLSSETGEETVTTLLAQLPAALRQQTRRLAGC